MKHKGFTLIELLVVIAIIAILAAILFPVFLGAKESALQVKCLSNMGQIGRGLNLYMQDWDHTFPEQYGEPPWGFVVFQPFRRPEARPNWAYSIYPYIRTRKVFVCPLVKHEHVAGVWWVDPEYDVSYRANGLLIGKKETAVTRMSKTVFMHGSVYAQLFLYLIPDKNGDVGQGWDVPMSERIMPHRQGGKPPVRRLSRTLVSAR